MATRVPLSKTLLTALQQQGYTHLQLRGIVPKNEMVKRDYNADDYLLIPRKQGITQFEDANLRIEHIDSSEIHDMLGVEFGIHFWVELPD